MKSVVTSVAHIVEEQCKSGDNIFGYEIWPFHIAVVVKYSLELAELLGADKEIVELAALLHDYASVKDESMYDDHHLYGAIEAERILRSLGYPDDKISRVKECIIQHRSSIEYEKTAVEAICIASADAMAHIDQVPSLLHLAYSKRRMGVSDGAYWVLRKIQKSWIKLCPEARLIIHDKYESAAMVLGSDQSVGQ